jgi:hypothetical protein
LLRAHGIVMFLVCTRSSCAIRLGTSSISRALALESLQTLFHELDLGLEIVDFIGFGGDTGYLIGQDLDIGGVVTTWIHCSRRESTRTKVVAHFVHEADDGPHFVLQSGNGLTDACNILVVTLDHVVVEGNLLF